MSINRWVVQDDTTGVSPVGFSQADAALMLRKCADHLGRCAQGAANANLSLAWNPVAAQATVTVGSTGTAADTLTVAGITITMETSGALPASNQVNIGGTVTTLAAQIVGLINGTTALSPNSWAGICTASNVAGVITLTASIPGTIGNGLALAKSSTALTITHAWGSSVAGTEGTAAVFSMGK